MPSELLKKHAAFAADKLEERGWIKGDLIRDYEWVYDNDGDEYDARKVYLAPEKCKMCALGALGLSYFGDAKKGMNSLGGKEKLSPEYGAMIAELADYVIPEWTAMRGELDDEPLESVEAVYTWNDVRQANADGVIAKLREIATS